MRANIRGLGIAVLSASLLVAPAFVGPITMSAAHAACLPGETVDGRSAEMAKRQAESAGYRDVQMEHKGCDNVWHGVAMQNGSSTRVAVEPSGQVMQEGD